jgi:hypothetical protein
MLKTTVWRCAPKLAGLVMLLAMSWGPAQAGDKRLLTSFVWETSGVSSRFSQ